MLQLSAVWLYQKHILWTMKVTAFLDLSKPSWCPWHGTAHNFMKAFTACLHGYTCSTRALVPAWLLLGAFQSTAGGKQEESVVVKPVGSSRAQKQVHLLNLPYIFIPLWEADWFQAKRITFKGDRPNHGPVKGQLCTVAWPSQAGQQKRKMELYEMLLCPASSVTALK